MNYKKIDKSQLPYGLEVYNSYLYKTIPTPRPLLRNFVSTDEIVKKPLEYRINDINIKRYLKNNKERIMIVGAEECIKNNNYNDIYFCINFRTLRDVDITKDMNEYENRLVNYNIYRMDVLNDKYYKILYKYSLGQWDRIILEFLPEQIIFNNYDKNKLCLIKFLPLLKQGGKIILNSNNFSSYNYFEPINFNSYPEIEDYNNLIIQLNKIQTDKLNMYFKLKNNNINIKLNVGSEYNLKNKINNNKFISSSIPFDYMCDWNEFNKISKKYIYEILNIPYNEYTIEYKTYEEMINTNGFLTEHSQYEQITSTTKLFTYDEYNKTNFIIITKK